VDPSASVGTYAGAPVLRRQARGGFAADPDQQRQGSFADADTDAIVVLEDGDGHSQRADRLDVQRLLWRAALVGDAADRVMGELHLGRAVVLVDAAEIAASEAQTRLEEVARAA
jgi:hypothetical protein